MTTIAHPARPLRNRFQVPPHMIPALGESVLSMTCSECHQKSAVGAFDYHEHRMLPDGTSVTITTTDLIDYAQDCGWGCVAGWLICPNCTEGGH